MPDPDAPPPVVVPVGAPPTPVTPLTRVVREVLAWALAGGLGAMAFLIVVQESANRGWSDQDLVEGFGLLVGAEGPDVPRQGFYWTVAVSLAVTLAFAAARPLRRRRFTVRAAAAGGAAFLLWGVVYGPLVANRTEGVEAGWFGAEAGIGTTIVVLAGSALYGVTVARVHGLVTDADWWEVKHFDLRASLEEIVAGPAPGPADEDPGEDVTRHPPIRH